MLTIKQKGNFSKLNTFLEKKREGFKIGILDKYGRMGVEALKKATPVDTGMTASSWYYKIERQNGIAKLIFCNSNVVNGVPVAIILQYGHATRNGGYVEGLDYINPALKPIFKQLADELWKEATKK